jgi:hypothetical protein
MQNLPLLRSPQVHIHSHREAGGVTGFAAGRGAPHSAQNLPALVFPQLQTHVPAVLLSYPAIFISSNYFFVSL